MKTMVFLSTLVILIYLCFFAYCFVAKNSSAQAALEQKQDVVTTTLEKEDLPPTAPVESVKNPPPTYQDWDMGYLQEVSILIASNFYPITCIKTSTHYINLTGSRQIPACLQIGATIVVRKWQNGVSQVIINNSDGAQTWTLSFGKGMNCQ